MKNPDLSRVKKILVIVLRNIGDVVLSTPIFKAIKENLPSSEIDALVNGGTEDILKGNPLIDHIQVLDRDARSRGIASRIEEERRLLK
ncbi:MAG: putative lipopolysaccharide heptosyltransferase III, partial [Deltaproteobacteria bacterium]|nr:putative lipopolysaccharide heptosyltransferase III [Deltaproteobacteria bacterium]